MNDYEKMVSGKFYNPEGESIVKIHEKGLCLQQQINLLPMKKVKKRQALMRKLIPNSDGDIAFFPPFHCEYGCNIKVGKNLFMNFDCVILDVAKVEIGDNVMLGSRVMLATPVHPLVAQERRIQNYPDGYHDIEYAKPITIGNDVWIASNVTVCGGVKIGDGSVIGAGSVVTKDIPSGVFAAGVPCKVIREITDADKMDPWDSYNKNIEPKRKGQ